MMKLDDVLIYTSVHIPDETQVRLIKRADEEIVSLRFGGEEHFVLELDDGIVPTLIQILESARSTEEGADTQPLVRVAAPDTDTR